MALNSEISLERVLKSQVADGSRSLTDPSVSNVVWDENQAIGMLLQTGV